MAEEQLQRPEMAQPYVPFVEMWVNEIDILRSQSGKPRTLISFSHDIYAGTGGFWTLEVFDPSYIAIEEIFISTATDITEVAEEAYGEAETGKEQDKVNISAARFRYGFVGSDPRIPVLSVSPEGDEFFFGTVHAYVPRYETNGTYLTIRGDSAGTRLRQQDVTYTDYADMSVLDIIKTVCKQREWLLRPINEDNADEIEGLLENMPVEYLKTDDGVLDTEEAFVSYKMRESEGPLSFINRLCQYVRTQDPKFNNFITRLEYRCKGPVGKGEGASEPQGYLYFGPEYYKAEPVRQYHFMRDPKSDVISFQPNVQVWVAQLSGAGGMTYKVDDARTGESKMHTVTEVSRTMKTDRASRNPVAFTLNDLGVLQHGKPEFPDEEEINRSEGQGSGPSRAAPYLAPEEDKNIVEATAHLNDERDADHQMMAYWLAMQTYVTRANLTIFGDPSAALAPGRTIAVYVYVPTENEEKQKEMNFHWTSSLWNIIGVNHEINGGDMRTNMELTRAGWSKGGVITKAAYQSLVTTLSPGQQRRLGGGRRD